MAEGGQSQTRIGVLTAELEGTKESLEKAKEENGVLSFCLQSLTDELERTKQELEKLKSIEHQSPHRCDDHRHLLSLAMTMHPDVDEDLKFVENEKANNKNNNEEETNKNNNAIILQNRRSVKFASPPELDRIMVNKNEESLLAQKPSLLSPPGSSSVKRLKKKGLVPLIGWLFAKKKGNH